MIQLLKLQIKLLYARIMAVVNLATPQGEKIYQRARVLLGTDASPRDLASDELGCAESVTNILAELFPPFQVITGTYTLYQALRGASEFLEVSSPLRGDIIISPTGLGSGNVSNGHVGIMGDNLTIMSNSSATGRWESNYTLDSWRQRYQVLGGYPVKFFRRII